MSGKYKTGEAAIAHFVTCTVVGLVDVFSPFALRQAQGDNQVDFRNELFVIYYKL